MLETEVQPPMKENKGAGGTSIGASTDWRARNQNPHIDIVSSKAKAAAGSGPLGYRELENVDSSTEYKSNDDKILSTTLNIEVKEVIDDSTLIGTWFTNQEFHQYIKFHVVRSNSGLVTNALTNGLLAVPSEIKGQNTTYEMINPWQSLEGLGTMINEGYIVPIGSFTLSDLLGDELKEDNPNYKNLSKVLEQNKTTTNDGLSVYSFSKTIKDYVQKGSTNPKHLSYFVITYIDFGALAAANEALPSDFNAVYINKEMGHMSAAGVGNVSSEIIIDNFKLHNKTYIFRDPTTGQIWPGPIHVGYQKGNTVYYDGLAAMAAGAFGNLTDSISSLSSDKTPMGIRAGIEQSNQLTYDILKQNIMYYAGDAPGAINPPIKLRRDTISNNKVQDFRSVKRIRKLNIDLSLLETLVSSVKFKGSKKSTLRRAFDYPSPETKELGRPDGYFTGLELTKDLSGQSRFMFGFDFKRYILGNSSFAGLFNDADGTTINSILAYSTIKRIKITRLRVKDSAVELMSKGDPSPYIHDYGYESFEKDKIPKVIVDLTNDKVGQAGGQIKSFSGRHGKLSEINLFKKVDNRIRHFTGVDRGMKNNSSGKYQYAVEIEIEDGGEKYMETVRNKFRKAINSLEVYYNRASNAVDISMKRFTENAGGSTTENLMSYRLPQDFIEKERATWTKPGVNPWVGSIDGFINMLKTVTPGGEKNPQGPLAFLGTYNELAKQMYNLVSPETGNVNSISAVLDIMRVIEQRINSVLETTPQHPKSRDDFRPNVGANAGGMKGRPTNKIKTMKIKYYFTQTYDASSGMLSGYDFLTSRIRSRPGIRTPSQISFNNAGLTTIPRSNYEYRTSEETKKYFKNDSQEINLGPIGSSNGPSLTSNTEFALYSFLSPSAIRLEGEPRPFRMSGPQSRTKTNKEYNEIMTKIILYNLGQGLQASANSYGNPRDVVGFKPGSPNAVKNSKNKNDLGLKALMASVLMERSVYVTAMNNPIIDAVNMNLVEASSGPTKQAITKSEFIKHTEVTSENPLRTPFGGRTDDTNLNVESDLFNVHIPFDINVFLRPPSHELMNIDVTYLLATLMGFSELVPPGAISLDNFSLDDPDTKKILMSFIANAAGEKFGKVIPNQIKSLMQVMRASYSPDDILTPSFSPETIAGKDFLFVGGLASTIGQQAMTPQLKDPFHEMDRYASFYMNYLNLVEVQALTGYSVGPTGAPLLNKPIWKKLTNEVFADKKDNRLLYCRLVKYNSQLIDKYEHPEVLELPIIDQYFFIENEDVTTSALPGNQYIDTNLQLSSDIMNSLVDKEKVNTLIDTEYTTSAVVNSAAFSSGAKTLQSAGGPATNTSTSAPMASDSFGSTGGTGY